MNPTIAAQDPQQLDPPRPIEAGQSLWAEELTWMEIRDLVKAGTTTIIIGTGGVEQNGPYVAGGKHNFVLQTVLPYIARAIPKSLIAPIVKFVPEGRDRADARRPHELPGDDQPRAGDLQGAAHRHLPQLQGARVHRHHPHRRQRRQPDAACATSRRRSTRSGRPNARACTSCPSTTTRIAGATISSRRSASRRSTRRPGQPADARVDTRNGMHDDIYYEAQIAVHGSEAHSRRGAPQGRAAEPARRRPVADMKKVVEIGKKLAEYRAGITAQAFKASKLKLRRM